MPSVVCSRLCFSWPDGSAVLSELNLTFPDGRTGLIGRNGSGKSTLLRLIAGELTPSSGSVTGPGVVGYLPQQLVLDRDRTVASVLGVEAALGALHRLTAGDGTAADLEMLGDAWDVEEKASAVLADLGFGEGTAAAAWLDRPISTLSGGEVVLLGLGAQLLADPDVLLLDEPTNNLDRSARSRLQQALLGWRRPVVVVSHDEELLDQMEHVVELRDGSARAFGGRYREFAEALAVEQDAAARAVRVASAELRRQQRELVDARIALDRRKRSARTAYEQKRRPRIVMNARKREAEVSAGRYRGEHEDDVARAREQLDDAEQRVRDDELIRIDLPGTVVPAGREVARLTDVVLRHGLEVSLHLQGPERVGLVGPNCVGKTTLVETLCGDLAPRAGSVSVGVPVRVLSQRLDLLADDEPVLAAVGRHAPSADSHTLRARLARFRLGADLVQRPVGTLSGGERFRATLAALLLAEPAPQLLVLDEPTNNLDLDSVAQLVSALSAYRGALLVVSHDERFLGRLALDRVVELGAAAHAGP